MIYFITCKGPGFQLPEFARFVTNPRERQALPQIVVDVQNGQPAALAPFRVKRVPPIEVLVLSPDGKPAAGAEVVLWEHKVEQFIEALTDPNNKEISSHVFTDAQGKAQLLAIGQPSVRATIKASLPKSGIVLEGETKLSSAPGQQNVVQLSTLRQGIQVIPGR